MGLSSKFLSLIDIPKIYELMTVLTIVFLCRSCTTSFSYSLKLCLLIDSSLYSTSSSTAQNYIDQGAMLDIDDVNSGDNGFWKLHSTHVTELSHASHLDFCIPRSQRHSLDTVGMREEVRAVLGLYLTAIGSM
jgi:hypothetical protein